MQRRRSYESRSSGRYVCSTLLLRQRLNHAAQGIISGDYNELYDMLQAESQARRIYLLQQAAKKRGEQIELPQAAVGPEPQHLAAQDEALEQSSAGAGESAVALQAKEEQPALLQHINFFAEHEAREAHPEVHC